MIKTDKVSEQFLSSCHARLATKLDENGAGLANTPSKQ
jgi:hypothetical protein